MTRWYLFSLLCLQLITSTCLAGLGGPNDGSNFHHFKSVTPIRAGSYTVQIIQVDGITVKEYESASGVIFAASWSGAKIPDLKIIFGEYYQEYLSAKAQHPPIRGQACSTFSSENVVVLECGRGRHITGIAYIPSLVPAGVNVHSLY